MKGVEFNKYFDIVVKKDVRGFKAGTHLYFKEGVTIVVDTEIKPILSKEQIQQARSLYGQGKSYREIAKLFEVSHMTIYRAINSDTYRDSAL